MNWYVVKIETQNGMRIGIDMEEIGEVICEFASEQDALNKSAELSQQLNIPQFDNEVDYAIF